MAAAKIEEMVYEDRISALPEDLLVTILLHVPIKDAIATMILSKRWRFIWTILPKLEYDFFSDGDEDDDDKVVDNDDDDESKKTSWCFFDKSMELHKAPVLTTLLIKLGPGCSSDIDVRKWIAKAVDHRVVVLRFKLSCSNGPTRLPKRIYTCGTLKELTLAHKVLLDFPSSCFLPSLVFLELLFVVYKDDASLDRFFSHCPVLNILVVKRNRRNRDDNITKFSVKIPSLEGLFYVSDEIISSLPDEDEVVDTGKCLAIDTPALLDLTIIDHSGDSFSIENMPCLDFALINVKSFPDIDKSKTSLSAVRSLVLYMTDQVIFPFSTVKFSRLMKLRICPHRSDWLEALLLLLKNSPKLTELLVDYAFTPDGIPLSWNQPNSIPGCLSSQLKFFEYREYGGRKEEKEFVMYILANSKRLRKAIISVKPDLENKNLIIEELRDIPRVSTFVEMICVG
ncbi:putative FBD-associated F-box protein At1g05080 [Brassica napus]|uniref:putative FBD-associated F-box protein At1g05080 n=1 Tax=Brassica napus TaxID=3708 RepID=UPI000BBF0508|nr:putative FBD-associated F-box protein At1g05080 [Brassica napus]XP_048621241.1 putative FBD-associated F-box protein At1g05080 [Brassica napus]